MPIYEVGEHEGHHYFSMKLVDGGNLAAQVERFRAAPRGRAAHGDGRPAPCITRISEASCTAT